ncbi:Uncharacterised protein [Escherichia coli]|uniref:Uncharacterized protein n=1 Tax=Escherichia coli TaxID=562 RepID=A0A377B6T3_ECOLX|nr:Uncharacterised protein [Escherichia coli]
MKVDIPHAQSSHFHLTGTVIVVIVSFTNVLIRDIPPQLVNLTAQLIFYLLFARR